jgi:nitrogenase-associated protein
MPKITFYVKPGETRKFDCKRLTEKGYDVVVRDLAEETWTSALLRPYFNEKPVAEWFDPNAPKIVSGAIDPSRMNAQGALVAMSADPDLIRTPLVNFAGRCAAGLSADEWPKFLSRRAVPCREPDVISEFWMHEE